MELFFSPDAFDLRRAARRLIEFLDYARQNAGAAGERVILQAAASAMAPIMPGKSEQLLRALGEEKRGWVTDWAGAV
jgi:hypothetical protein